MVAWVCSGRPGTVGAEGFQACKLHKGQQRESRTQAACKGCNWLAEGESVWHGSLWLTGAVCRLRKRHHQAEAARSQRDHVLTQGWGTLHWMSFHAHSLPTPPHLCFLQSPSGTLGPEILTSCSLSRRKP